MGGKITAESGQPTNEIVTLQSPFSLHSSMPHISASLINEGFSAAMCLM